VTQVDSQVCIVACNREPFWRLWRNGPLPSGVWIEVHSPEELQEQVKHHRPRYIFFPHWSEFVPKEITENYECVCFHAAPVPFGRGGSPVQNMIAAGYEETRLSALRMTEVLDGGPIYLSVPVSLLGGGDEIFVRLYQTVIRLMHSIRSECPTPVPQEGSPTVFKRRTPEQSELNPDLDLQQVFNQIRMLDAEGYPSAFIRQGNLRIEFSRPSFRGHEILADARIHLSRKAFNLRPASSSDTREVWRINNHPSVRRMSLNSGDIPLEEHLCWYERALADDQRRFYVTEVERTVAAVTRLDIEGLTAIITVAVAPEARGKKLGRASVQAATVLFTEERPEIALIKAYILPENVASQILFLSSGYLFHGVATIQEKTVLEYHHTLEEKAKKV
jgi:methionyl-tRNA formyltransferase